ncbi:MAG: substrate-binding domain-containing protein [Oscillospiraceae bacterium]|jgi:D-xylose transport system substrate-binding protein|nr:substrate-binding domain-containing protein [Oscillospiraceae bacterium]
MKKLVAIILTLTLCCIAAVAFASAGAVKIGMAMGDLRLERWQRDVAYMEAAAAEYGYELTVLSADGDENTQLNQIETMLGQGIQVLLIMPVSSKTMSTAVDACHADGVKVISYDRMIENADLDYFVTFDTEGVGRMQASSLLKAVPGGGKWFQITGNADDSNGQLFEKGQMAVIQPLIDEGKITIVGYANANGWNADAAMPKMEDALTANDNQIDAVLAANDGIATGCIAALTDQGLAGKIPVTGQDADLIACQHIAEGTQYMTVYKPLNQLAYAAIDFAGKVVKGEDVSGYINIINNNGKVDVPTYALPLTEVTKDNLIDTIIKDGFHSYEEVYANVPEDQRPPRP